MLQQVGSRQSICRFASLWQANGHMLNMAAAKSYDVNDQSKHGGMSMSQCPTAALASICSSPSLWSW